MEQLCVTGLSSMQGIKRYYLRSILYKMSEVAHKHFTNPQ